MADDYRHAVSLRVPQMDMQDTFDLLTDAYDRAVLHVLSTRQSPVDLETVATAISRTDVATDVEQTWVRVRLVHSTLPRLEAHGLLEYDREQQTVTALVEPSMPTSIQNAESVVVTVSDRDHS